MEDNQKFSAEQSLQIIKSMIEKAKHDVARNSFYLLLWGWLVFVAAMSHFLLMKLTNFSQPWLVWNLMLIGVIASIVRGIKESKKETVKTYIGETMKYFGICLAILYCSLTFIFGYNDLWKFSYPIYILIYAVACFFMGSVMQFNLLRLTGLLCLPIMILSIYVPYEWQLPLMALAILISYIIPGHVLNLKEKRQNK